jgi:hypothetical protein
MKFIEIVGNASTTAWLGKRNLGHNVNAVAYRGASVNPHSEKTMKLKPGIVYKIELADEGQDFTQWYVKNRIVIDCQPFQASIWVGTKVTSEPKIGEQLNIVTRHAGQRTLDYPVREIIELRPEQAAEAEEAFRAWLQEVESE